MYTNCDTLTNKICELKLAIDSNDPDIIVLSEVTPKNNCYILQKSEIEIRGYNSYISNFEDTNTRGVALYVKKCITSNQIELANAAKDTVWVEITLEKEKKMIIGGIYRSPNNSKSNNTLLFETIYTASQLNKDNILLMGDFNCSEINWEDISTTDQNTESLSFKLIETIRDCFLHQVIMENTRARGTNNPSLLDLVLCYDAMLINNIEYHSLLGKSDHSVIYYNYQVEYMKCTYKIKKTFYDKGDYKAIQEYLKEIDWKQMFIGKGVQQMWDLLVETLKECEARFIPNKIVEINGDAKYKETFNITIRKNIKQKHNLWKRYMETRSPVVYGKYCRMRNKVKNMIKYTRKQKEKQISGNIKTTLKLFGNIQSKARQFLVCI